MLVPRRVSSFQIWMHWNEGLTTWQLATMRLRFVILYFSFVLWRSRKSKRRGGDVAFFNPFKKKKRPTTTLSAPSNRISWTCCWRSISNPACTSERRKSGSLVFIFCLISWTLAILKAYGTLPTWSFLKLEALANIWWLLWNHNLP